MKKNVISQGKEKISGKTIMVRPSKNIIGVLQ